MSRKQYELATTTQALEFYPPEGVPTAATVAIYTSATASLLVPTAVVLDTANQALGAHVEGATTLTVASSAAFVVGRKYWLDDGYKGHEVEVYAIPAGGLTLVLTEPIRRAITTGSIKGHGMRRTLTAAETGSVRRRLRVVWRYTVVTALVAEELVDVVRWPFSLPITEGDIERADPSAIEQAGSFGAWSRWKDAGVEDVWQALEGAGVSPDLMRSRDLLVRPAVYRALHHRHARDEQLSAHYLALFDAAWAHVLSSRDSWYDADDDLVPDESAASGDPGWVEVGAGSGIMVQIGSAATSGYQIGASRMGETDGLPGARRLKVM